jgi:hypothetical protein
MVFSALILPLAFDFLLSAAFLDAALVFEAFSLAALDFYFLRVSLPLAVFDIFAFLSLEAFASLMPCFSFLRISCILVMFNGSPLTKDLSIFYLNNGVSLYLPILEFGCST